MSRRVEYDRVASVYDRRYGRGKLAGVAEALRRATREAGARRALEVGCGTGEWLGEYGAPSGAVGADRSLGMLAKAAAKHAASAPTEADRAPVALLAAEAHALPFAGERFGLVAMVHALHHFGDPARYLAQVAALLHPGGAVVVIGLDPSAGRDRWYLYDYFPETLPIDRERYPAHASVRRWLRELGFERVTTRTAARIQATQIGRQVLDDPILHRYGTSQLTLLDQEAFDRGMARVRDAAERDAACAFVTDLELPVTRGFRPR